MKNRNFFRKVRLCLCLFGLISLSACGVVKLQSVDSNAASYRIIAEVMPGFDATFLSGVGIVKWDDNALKEIGVQSWPFSMIVRVNTVIQAQQLREQFVDHGIFIREMVRLSDE